MQKGDYLSDELPGKLTIPSPAAVGDMVSVTMGQTAAVRGMVSVTMASFAAVEVSVVPDFDQ